MSDVNKEKARREAVENVGNRPPTEGENRVQAAMRRYLGAEVFHEVHPHEKAKTKAAEKGGSRARRRARSLPPSPRTRTERRRGRTGARR